MIIKRDSNLNEIAKNFLKEVGDPVFIFLNGNMGAGKTTFVRHCMDIIGTTDNVSSPTFAIIHEYTTNTKPVFHLDLHRLEKIDHFILNEIEEISEKHLLTFIEWPNVIKKSFNYPFKEIYFN